MASLSRRKKAETSTTTKADDKTIGWRAEDWNHGDASPETPPIPDSPNPAISALVANVTWYYKPEGYHIAYLGHSAKKGVIAAEWNPFFSWDHYKRSRDDFHAMNLRAQKDGDHHWILEYHHGGLPESTRKGGWKGKKNLAAAETGTTVTAPEEPTRSLSDLIPAVDHGMGMATYLAGQLLSGFMLDDLDDAAIDKIAEVAKKLADKLND